MRELARRIGIPYSSVANFVSGWQPGRSEILRKVAQELSVPLPEIMEQQPRTNRGKPVGHSRLSEQRSLSGQGSPKTGDPLEVAILFFARTMDDQELLSTMARAAETGRHEIARVLLREHERRTKNEQ